jgi:hypothetical protein
MGAEHEKVGFRIFEPVENFLMGKNSKNGSFLRLSFEWRIFLCKKKLYS